jgi:cytosine/uracil/thiamine/allantoin permease
MELSQSLGLSTAPFVAFGIGVLCLLGALGVGLVFSARTMLDWQAVQLWRMEWLLGAVAAFVAGCLLKKKP